MTHPLEEIFDLKFSSTGDEIISTATFGPNIDFGFVEMINREEEFVQIYVTAE